MALLGEYGKLALPLIALVLALISRAITPAKRGGRGFTVVAKLLVACTVLLGIVLVGARGNSQVMTGVGLMALMYLTLLYAIAEAVVFALWRRPPPDANSE